MKPGASRPTSRRCPSCWASELKGKKTAAAIGDRSCWAGEGLSYEALLATALWRRRTPAPGGAVAVGSISRIWIGRIWPAPSRNTKRRPPGMIGAVVVGDWVPIPRCMRRRQWRGSQHPDSKHRRTQQKFHAFSPLCSEGRKHGIASRSGNSMRITNLSWCKIDVTTATNKSVRGGAGRPATSTTIPPRHDPGTARRRARRPAARPSTCAATRRAS
jgi:hypothetical protein